MANIEVLLFFAFQVQTVKLQARKEVPLEATNLGLLVVVEVELLNSYLEIALYHIAERLLAIHRVLGQESQ